MIRILPWFLLCAALSYAPLCCAPLSVHAQGSEVRVEMNADRKELGMGDNVAVRVYVQTKSSGQPNIEVPEFNGFQVVQRAVQRPMQFSFGFGQAAPVVTSTTQYTFVLAPMGPGTYKIPPVRVTLGQQVFQSQPLVLTVTGPGGQAAQGQAQAQASQPGQAQDPQVQAAQPQAAAATPAPQNTGDGAVFDQEAFLRTVVDKVEPFEGEQVTATIYLYTHHNLQQVPAVQAEASTDGLWVHDLLSAARALEPTRQVVNGRGFWVYVLRRFAGFPLRSGELTLGSMALTLSHDAVFDLFGSNSGGPTNVQRSSVPIVVRVKPLPAEHKPQGPIAVGNFELKASLDRKQVVTGDAVTLTATLSGKGNLSSVKIADPALPGLQVLQPEVHDLTQSPGDSVQSTRSFGWLIVPNNPGTYTIPALAINTFDPATQSYKRVQSEPLTLVAAGAARAVAAPGGDKGAPADEAAENRPADEAWPPVHPHSQLARTSKPLTSYALYPLLLLFWPLLWLGSVLGPIVLARIRARGADTGERAALREARTRLHAAQTALQAKDARRFHADVASALQTTLEARLGEAVSGLTQNALRSMLAERGMPSPLSNAVCEVLAQCDFARFSPAGVSETDMQGLLAKALQLWNDVAAFAPSAKEGA